MVLCLFFKLAWRIIGKDFMKVIQHFFTTGHMLKKVNYTILAFVPKCTYPSFYKDFRLIVCYNVIYKYMSKIMVNWLKSLLPLFMNQAQ